MVMEYSRLLPCYLSILSLCFSLGVLLYSMTKRKMVSGGRLPPGPPFIPFVGSILWPKESLFDIEATLHRLFSEYGPVVTLHFGSRIAIFIKDHGFSHQALFQKGASVCDRLFHSGYHTVSFASYGPLWRLLRHNLRSRILHPSSVKLFARDRKQALSTLVDKILLQAERRDDDGVIVISESFSHALFGLQASMCFGAELDEKALREMKDFQAYMLSQLKHLSAFAFLPQIARLVFPKKWNTLLAIRRKHEELFTPLVTRARQEKLKHKRDEGQNSCNSYVDTLLELEIPEEGRRKLSEVEILSLCGEFMVVSTDNIVATVEWIMANLVRRHDIQTKLVEEIENVVGKFRQAINEDELERMPYLKAVVLEGLRRHPPAHFVLPHTVTEEITVEGYVLPKKATLNFRPMEMGRDETVWKEPMEFTPERFLAGGEGEGVDLTGSREIKMMPFSAGRRMCPGLGIATLHIKYFVANLIWKFEWKVVDGEEIDMAEEPAMVAFMKNPLRARIIPRGNTFEQPSST